MMKQKHNIVIFGGQGRTGREVAILSAIDGHNVTVFAHHDNNIFPKNLGIKYVTGDVRNKDDVGRAIKGNEIVINIVAPKLFDKKNYDVSLVATKNIISEMKQANVKRYLSQCGAWATDNLDDASPPMRLVFSFFTPLKSIYRFKRREDREVINSGLDWTVFRAALLTDGIAKKVSVLDKYKCRFWEIPRVSRKSLAKIYLDNLDNPETYKKFLVVLD
jgi:putative NADH-flavin reductase